MGIVKWCIILTVRLIIPEQAKRALLRQAGQAKRVLLVNKFPNKIEV